MKRTRRVSLTIEHRKISISHNLRESRTGPTSAQPDALPTPPVCSICGAPWTAVELQGTAVQESGVDALSTEQIFTQPIFAELLQRGLHPVIYFGGKLWMCGQSLQHLRDGL